MLHVQCDLGKLAQIRRVHAADLSCSEPGWEDGREQAGGEKSPKQKKTGQFFKNRHHVIVMV
jgi:hypothetical protein